eukprot:TRINITY_DN10595_c0_g1_i1.p1 TRINITY_DN10595_c0_g1~~TRINITY_DN10595_c0_g1_i1.p1  ORF type:complete len:140 (+),score=41.84 TRINITY_DN10595_c0_g1_i1:177-596(+)
MSDHEAASPPENETDSSTPGKKLGRRPSLVEEALVSLISDVNTLKANAYVMRKDIESEEKRSEEIVNHCDSLMNVSSAAIAVVHAVRWKRKIAQKKLAGSAEQDQELGSAEDGDLEPDPNPNPDAVTGQELGVAAGEGI